LFKVGALSDFQVTTFLNQGIYDIFTPALTNRKITDKDLDFIQAVVHEHWDKGRTQISRILCTKWNRFMILLCITYLSEPRTNSCNSGKLFLTAAQTVSRSMPR